MRGELEPVRGVLKGRRLIARREMSHALRSDRAQRLRADWEELLMGLEQRPAADRPDARRPIGEVASRRIRRVYARMLRIGAAIDATSPPEEYHELRKKGKELRYLLELFGVPLNDEAVVRPMIKALKGLQDVLGRHQDREVQIATLRSLADEVCVMNGGSAALMAMGLLIERLHQDAGAARAEFAQSFAAFSSAEQRRLVKETFR
jgi:CHAD domain-containing protein